MKDYGIGKEATMIVGRRLRGDIGIFGEHSDSQGREEFLTKIPAYADHEKVNELIRSLNGA
jgi:hypothetical protein